MGKEDANGRQKKSSKPQKNSKLQLKLKLPLEDLSDTVTGGQGRSGNNKTGRSNDSGGGGDRGSDRGSVISENGGKKGKSKGEGKRKQDVKAIKIVDKKNVEGKGIKLVKNIPENVPENVPDKLIDVARKGRRKKEKKDLGIDVSKDDKDDSSEAKKASKKTKKEEKSALRVAKRERVHGIEGEGDGIRDDEAPEVDECGGNEENRGRGEENGRNTVDERGDDSSLTGDGVIKSRNGKADTDSNNNLKVVTDGKGAEIMKKMFVKIGKKFISKQIESMQGKEKGNSLKRIKRSGSNEGGSRSESGDRLGDGDGTSSGRVERDVEVERLAKGLIRRVSVSATKRLSPLIPSTLKSLSFTMPSFVSEVFVRGHSEGERKKKGKGVGRKPVKKRKVGQRLKLMSESGSGSDSDSDSDNINDGNNNDDDDNDDDENSKSSGRSGKTDKRRSVSLCFVLLF